MEAQVYERMAELDSDHWWFVARRDILQNLIERVVQPPKNARILEVGCGEDQVRAERHGREIAYSLVDEHVAHIVADAVTHAAEQRP